MNVLKVYARCTVQLINFEKSSVFYSSNVNSYTRLNVGRTLGVSCGDSLEKYLGLPCIVGRNKKWAFASLRDKIGSQISSWSSKMLSIGGREVFIKSVFQAMSTFAMMCFLLPKMICSETIMAQFWWQKSGVHKGLHWCDWSKLCMLKKDGGMGFHDLANFNISLLVK